MEESRTQVILCISSTVLKLLFLKTATIKVGNTSVKCLHSPPKETLILCTVVVQVRNNRQQHLKRSLRNHKDVRVWEKNKNR